VKTLPVATQIEQLLAEVEALLSSVVDRTLTDDKSSPTSESVPLEVDQESAAGLPPAALPESSTCLAGTHA
jgi:hypothetical protein